MIGYGVVRMRSNKSMRYVYVEYDFYKEEKPLIRDDMDDKQKQELRKKITELRREIEDAPLNLPSGVRGEIKIIPNGNGKEFVGSMEVMVYEQGFKGWGEFIKEKGGAEQFIKDVLDERRARLIEKIKELKMEETMKIDVRVLGKSGYHRVYGEGKDLKCDCKLFERNGECHHVELVKSMMREGKVKEGTKEIEPPMVVWNRGEGEIKYDKERHTLIIPTEDKNPTKTIRMLHDWGYGLGAMKEMHVIPRKFKLQQLENVLHGMSYEAAVEQQEQEMEKTIQEIRDMNMEMEMGG